jgi:rhodanese-related sulfurtransferase
MKDHTSGSLNSVADAKKSVKELSVRDVAQKFQRGEKFYFVDVREDEEWRAGHAQGAMHLAKGVIERDINEAIPDKNAPIVLYCGGGTRSVLAAEAIQKMGYTNVVSMDGGMYDWREAGLPEEK